MRYAQPQAGPLTLDATNKYGKAAAFISVAGLAQDPVSRALPTAQNATRGTTTVGTGWKCSGSGKQVEYNLAPLTTSDGAGTGDFTIFAYSDAASSDAIGAMFSQKNDALGAPYTQIGLLANSDANGATFAGRMTLLCYSGGGFNQYADGVFDGQMHLVMAVRRAGAFYLYRDGVLLSSTFAGALSAGTTVYRAGQKTGIGSTGNATTEPYSRVLPFVGALNMGMTDADARDFYANPYQLFFDEDAELEPMMLAGAAAGGSNTQVTTGAGALTLAGYAPTLAQTANQALTPGAGSMALTGYAPTLTQSGAQSITPGAGSLALTGYAPTLTQSANQTVSPGSGTLAIASYAPTVAQTANRAITPGTGMLAVTGFAPSVVQAGSLTFTPGPAALSIVGYAPTVMRSGSPAPYGPTLVTIMRDVAPTLVSRMSATPPTLIANLL